MTIANFQRISSRSCTNGPSNVSMPLSSAPLSYSLILCVFKNKQNDNKKASTKAIYSAWYHRTVSTSMNVMD